MKNGKTGINRRSFLERTGMVIAGMTIIPSHFPDGSEKGEASVSSDNFARKILSGSDSVNAGVVTGWDNKWWESEPLRIVEFEKGYEFREKFALLDDLGANVEHATRFTDTAPGTSFLDAHNLFSGKKVNFGSLEDYLAEAHMKGIKVIIYFNVHAIEINYARKHPDWQQIKDDGRPIEDVYSVDSSFCINSPWREEVFKTLRTLSAYNIDGIFYDGPIFFAGTCHCGSCGSLYHDRYGRDLPSKTKLSTGSDNSSWHDLLEFQSDSIETFLRESNRILKNARSSILLYMNGNTLAPSWPTGRVNRKIIRETDILGAEGGFLYGSLKEPIYKPGAMAKLLETQAGGKPTVVFDAAKQGPWSFSTLPAGEISLLYSQTITHQANVWLAISAVDNLHDNEISTIKKFNRFIAKNPDPFFRTRSMAGTALVWPQESGNYYQGSSVPLTDFTREIKPEKAGNTEEEFYGFYKGLSANHVPFDVLDEEALTSDLSRYELLVLPNVTCLSREQAAKIRDFVNKGGNIISSFEISAYDETGNKRAEPWLSDVLGIEKAGDLFGPLAWDYVAPADRDHFILKGIKNQFLIAPGYGLKVRATGRTPVVFCKPLPGSYSGSPQITDTPFIVENTFGKGKSLYFAGTFGGSLFRYNFPEYYSMLENMVNEYTAPFVRLFNAPSSVEVNIRKKENYIYVYLVNFTSEMKRPIRKIIPCQNIGIEVPVTQKIREVRSLWQSKKLKYTESNGKVTFRLDQIEDYDVIRIIT